ncbi:MAG: hypothetical protein IT502_01955 [Rubrivivax sp.]|nr:hypothetical protein [Rubrivivax sp.]
MTPQQQAAIEAVYGSALSEAQALAVAPMVDERRDKDLADYLSQGRTEIRPRMTSARGIAERMSGGPLAAEVVLIKLEGARDALLASASQNDKVLGSLLRRQLGFLAGEGLDFGSAALRGMLDQFVTAGILTAGEVAALKAIAEFAAPIEVVRISDALNALGA